MLMRLLADSCTSVSRAVNACPTLTPPSFGSLNRTTGNTFDEVRASCNAGYTRVGAGNLVCMTSGSWSVAVPTCQANPCPALSNPPFGTFSALSGVTATVVTFSCAAGYSVVGATSLTCTAAGSWSAASPTCSANPCPTLTVPSFGSLSATTGVTADVVTASCNAGYTRIGAASLTCQTSGAWSAAVPTCQGNHCIIASAAGCPSCSCLCSQRVSGAVQPAAGQLFGTERRDGGRCHLRLRGRLQRCRRHVADLHDCWLLECHFTFLLG